MSAATDMGKLDRSTIEACELHATVTHAFHCAREVDGESLPGNDREAPSRHIDGAGSHRLRAAPGQPEFQHF